jgi:hypothetical protein
MDVKKEYDKLSSKYKLPDFEELNTIFDIADLNGTTHILSKIREKITEKIEAHAKLLGSIVQPENNLTDMYEARYLNESTRKKAYVLFKKITRFVKLSQLTSVKNTQKENADFITKTFESWRKIDDDLHKLLDSVASVWKQETNPKQDLSYFG